MTYALLSLYLAAGSGGGPAEPSRARLARLMEEAAKDLHAAPDRAAIDARLDALEQQLAADPLITADDLQAAADERDRINKRAASHGPVPHPDMGTMAVLYGMPQRLARAAEAKRAARPDGGAK